MSTINDVANLAGVSVATVSRVMTNSNKVSETTKNKVLQAVEKLDYKPNMVGRSLRTANTHMILALVPSISNPFYAEIVQGIENTLNKNDYYLLLCNTYSNSVNYTHYLNLLHQHMADGLIWMDPTSENLKIKNLAEKYPLVSCAENNSLNISTVSIDNKSATFDAIQHLFKRGHRKIAFFGASMDYDYMQHRHNGYIEAINHFGIGSYYMVKTVGFDEKITKQAFRDLYFSAQRCDAIFAISDVIAQYILEEARELNINIGKDMGLVGFDNLDFTSVTCPKLTTVDQPRYQIGETAAKLLLNTIKSHNLKIDHVVLPHKLIARESSLGITLR